MSAIVNRLLILACCISQLPARPIGTVDVTALLAAVTVSALNGYFELPALRRAGIGLFLAASLVDPSFCLFLPVVYYDAFEGVSTWSVLAAAGALIASFACLPARLAYAVIALTAVSWALRLHADTAELRHAELRQLRDSTEELTMQLTQKNKELLQRQDGEIRLATLNERARIAREIHDHVGHLLSRSILQVGALMAAQQQDGQRDCQPDEQCEAQREKIHEAPREGRHEATREEQRQSLRASLSVIRDTLSQAMNSIRASVHDLHDESFDLRTQVEELVRNFSFCEIRLNYRLESDPYKEAAYCFIAIIREGLNNIMRHSDATQVNLSLQEHPALYQLVLQDNGSGPRAGLGPGGRSGLGLGLGSAAGSSGGSGLGSSPGSGLAMGSGGAPGLVLGRGSDSGAWTAAAGDGLGLRSIADRVAALGGQFLVEHRGGFRLFISVPKKKVAP
jgi:signal transduction histidine kinase